MRTYLNWRFADAHDAAYELLRVPREERPAQLRGLVTVVCNQREWVFPDDLTTFLADWLAPADDDDATIALVAKAEERASALGTHALATLFQHRDPRFLQFQKLGFLVYGTTYFQVVIPFDRHDAYFYKEEWYHTLGDSDLI